MSVRDGADALARALAECGVRVVFGVPGGDAVALFDAVCRAGVRVVLTATELGAAFAANGLARTGGGPGVILTIHGPGFTYALTGLAEAMHDSAALVCLVPAAPGAADGRFALQAIDQRALAMPLVKAFFALDSAAAAAAVVREAVRCAVSGGPGPVVVEYAPAALREWLAANREDARAAAGVSASGGPAGGAGAADAAARFFAGAARPLILAGQGAAGAAGLLRDVAERFGAPVLATPSARGVLPEDHPLCISFDIARGGLGHVTALVDAADAVLALGCRLSHNGTAGYALRLPADRLVHVDADAAAAGAACGGRHVVVADAACFLERLRAAAPTAGPSGVPAIARWPDGLPERVRAAVRVPDPAAYPPEPRAAAAAGGTVEALIAALRRTLPRDAIVATDAGAHQSLVRRHFDVLSPRGLLLPTDYQSMGFGLPAALGAALAAPDRPVVAVIGDGGLLMTGTELATAVRERVPLVVVVLADGHLGQIRTQQLLSAGRATATALPALDLEAFARAVGAGYIRPVPGGAEAAFRSALGLRRPVLVEVALTDALMLSGHRAAAAVRTAARTALDAAGLGAVVRAMRRARGS